MLHQSLRKELIRINIDCNANCCFCNFSKENEKNFNNPSTKEIFSKIDRLVSHGVEYVVFSGGEPLIHKDIIKIIDYANQKGVKEIELQTNAIALDKEKIKELKQAGLNKVFVSLHTNNNFINKKLFATPYNFNEIVENLKYLNNLGIKVTLNPVINNLTYKSLPVFAEYIVKELDWVDGISLSVVQPHGQAYKNKNLLPDYSKISNYIVLFKKIINKNTGIEIINPYCGIPICIGGWLKDLNNNVEYIEGKHLKNKDKNKTHLEICHECVLNNYCNGVWKEYLDIFGEEVITKWLNPIKND